jgi:hypothetical protein
VARGIFDVTHLDFENEINWNLDEGSILVRDVEPTLRLDSVRNVITVKAASSSAIDAYRNVPGMKTVSSAVRQQGRGASNSDHSARLNDNSTFFQWKLNITNRLDHAKKIQVSRQRSKTVLKSLDMSRIKGSDHHMIVNETIMGQKTLVQIQASNNGRILPTEAVKQELRKKFKASLDFSVITRVDRIYYINMGHRPRKRAIMESWLSKQPIPHHRVRGQKGETDSCISRKQGPRCLGISGLTETALNIVDNLNTMGFTLVVEDDFVIRDMKKLLASIHLVPPDWDILRWDCWDQPLPHFKRYPYSFEVGPVNEQVCQGISRCWYCGGTHVALWKGGASLEKLRRIWGTLPYDGIDCRLSDPSIKSYCIQVGVGEFHTPVTERSDIPKTGED